MKLELSQEKGLSYMKEDRKRAVSVTGAFTSTLCVSTKDMHVRDPGIEREGSIAAEESVNQVRDVTEILPALPPNGKGEVTAGTEDPLVEKGVEQGITRKRTSIPKNHMAVKPTMDVQS